MFAEGIEQRRGGVEGELFCLPIDGEACRGGLEGADRDIGLLLDGRIGTESDTGACQSKLGKKLPPGGSVFHLISVFVRGFFLTHKKLCPGTALAETCETGLP